jgi:hypothetical protein
MKTLGVIRKSGLVTVGMLSLIACSLASKDTSAAPDPLMQPATPKSGATPKDDGPQTPAVGASGPVNKADNGNADPTKAANDAAAAATKATTDANAATKDAKAATDAAKKATDDASTATTAAKAATDAATKATTDAKTATKAANDAAAAVKAANDAAAAKNATPPPEKMTLVIEKIEHSLVPSVGLAPLPGPPVMYVDFISGDSEDDKTASVDPSVRLALRLADVSVGDDCEFTVFLDTDSNAVLSRGAVRARGQFKASNRGKKTFRYTTPAGGPGAFFSPADASSSRVSWHFTIYWRLVD